MVAISELAGVVLDTDGVITSTASVHAAAWKHTFDIFLAEWGERVGKRYPPFDVYEDYPRHVDGRSREDGIRAFLASRGIALPEEPPAEDPETPTVTSLGRRKNDDFLQRLSEDGAAVIHPTIEMIHRLRRAGTTVAAVSASRNCASVLRAAGVGDLVDVRVDGVDADRLGLAGKPAPDLFLEAARRMGLGPHDCAVVEDARSGVQAGRRGGFALVVGLDRSGQSEDLYRDGADVVVEDLTELERDPARGGPA
ncbi:HAD family hydrolase [Halostreptopolyspora alba]|uniref:HAD family hydrolase n=1 Tax=Halostreptopolyspora alba TaxID=2487137 RepID=A0A3N0EGG5_9ACTN|nr:HAD family hydrolase [Nocardiopsaceae bacterium YIM 96095]